MNDYKLVKNTEWKEVEVNGELKEIPIEWNVKQISELAKIIPGQSPDSNYVGENDGIDFHQGNTLFNNKYIKSSHKKILESNAKKIAPPNSILVSVRAPVGDLNINKNKIAIGRGLAALCPKVNIEFLFNILRLNKDKITALGSGSTFEGMRISDFSEFQVICSINQQSAIADILSSQESIIQDIESLISKYESRFQYLSEELLSGRLRVKEVEGQLKLYKNADNNWKEVEVNGDIKDIPQNWDVEKVEKLFSCSMGQTILSNSIVGRPTLNFIPVYSATEENKYFGYIEKTKIRNVLNVGDIVIPARGNSIGFVKLVTNESTSTQTTIQLKSLYKINSHFIFYLFKKYKEAFFPVNPGTIPQLTVAEVNNLDIVYMNELESNKIVNFLKNQEDLINQQKELLSKEKQKFDWLLDNLLSGKYLVQEQ